MVLLNDCKCDSLLIPVLFVFLDFERLSQAVASLHTSLGVALLWHPPPPQSLAVDCPAASELDGECRPGAEAGGPDFDPQDPKQQKSIPGAS